MNNFIQRLVLRQHSSRHHIRPRMRSRFELSSSNQEIIGSLSLDQPTTSENNPTPTSKQTTITPILLTESIPSKYSTIGTTHIIPKQNTDHQKSNLFSTKSPQLVSKNTQEITPKPPQENKTPSTILSPKKSQQTPIVETSIQPQKETFALTSVQPPKETFVPRKQIRPNPKAIEPSIQIKNEKTIIQPLAHPTFKRTATLAKQNINFAKRNTPTPTIKINIGRIEVKAIVETPPPTPLKKRAKPKPNLSLEDYLKKR